MVALQPQLQLQTQFPFTLPKGFVDAEGQVHREGVMRLATAMDEIVPMRDPRVKGNQAYLTVLILARVITRLGNLPAVDETVIENLFAADLAYLQDLYRRINSDGIGPIIATCPMCEHRFQVELGE